MTMPPDLMVRPKRLPAWLPENMRHAAAPENRLYALLASMRKRCSRAVLEARLFKICALCRQINPDVEFNEAEANREVDGFVEIGPRGAIRLDARAAEIWERHQRIVRRREQAAELEDAPAAVILGCLVDSRKLRIRGKSKGRPWYPPEQSLHMFDEARALLQRLPNIPDVNELWLEIETTYEGYFEEEGLFSNDWQD